MKTSQLLNEAITVKGAKTASYTRMLYSSLASAMEKAFGVSMDGFGYGDEIVVLTGLTKLAPSTKSNGMLFKEVLKDPKGLGLDFFYYLEDRTVNSHSIEQSIEALISVGVLTSGNFIVDIDDRRGR